MSSLHYLACSVFCFTCREGTGTKVVYGDNRRYLRLDHPFRVDASFGARERRPAPPLRSDCDVRSEAKAVAAARGHFRAKPRSVHDPARASGVSGESELLRDESFNTILQWPVDWMHIVVRLCIVGSYLSAHCLCPVNQEGVSKHIILLFLGQRTWDGGESDAARSDEAAADAKRLGYLVTAQDIALVEQRLGGVLFPPGLASSSVRKIFKYTGNLNACRSVLY
jgi:hypothetical protein